jgi:hypothetical protein
MILPAGTPLFHGTDAEAEFQIPRGPAWFSPDRRLAGKWAGWASTSQPKPRRVLVYETTTDLELLDWRGPGFAYKDYQALSRLAADEDEASPYQIAQWLHGRAAGWLAEKEIVLVEPDRSLRFVEQHGASGKPFGRVAQ